ncbi:MAG: 2-phospho-L-lactate transferase [Gammaproteobacteria bacterium]
MSRSRVVALSGGIGGAKLALGLYRVLEPGELMVVANVGDDFEHLGLHVSPDIDTLMYTLADLNNRDTGWGRRAETWHFMEALVELGGESWFALGDRDLATHVERTRRLRAGESLSAITQDLCERVGIAARIVPASDAPVRTVVHTAQGDLEFQHYFVREQCRPVVQRFSYAGAEQAIAHADVVTTLAGTSARPAPIDAVVICPSNPFISIDPMLAIPRLRQALVECKAPVIAVSPIIAGEAVKGPTAKMMEELGLPCTAAAVAAHYEGIIDGYVIDRSDAALAEVLSVPSHTVKTLMHTDDDRDQLAREVLAFAQTMGHRD